MGPLRRHRVLPIVTSSLLLTEFVLFLLISFSLPIIKSIYILGVNSHFHPGRPDVSAGVRLRFGVWGVCAYSTPISGWWLHPDGLCYGPTVGYQIPDLVLDITGHPKLLAKAIPQALTALLVLHPIVAALSFVGAVTSLFLDTHSMFIISLVFTIANALLSSTVFAADLAINVIARDPKLTGRRFDAEWGNAIWLVLVGVVLSWLGVMLLSIPFCRWWGVSEMYHTWEAKRFKGGRSDQIQMTER